MTIYKGLIRRGKDHKTTQPIIINGRRFDSLRVAAGFYSMSGTTLKKRLDAGMTPEQAVGLEK